MNRAAPVVLAIAALLAATVAPPAIAADAPRIAVFPFELNDTSGEQRDTHDAEQARLAMVTQVAGRMLAERGAEIVDVSAYAGKLETMPRLWQCNGCEVPLAREAGADIAITGMVHKVSTLIQSILLIARDTESGRIIGNASVSIRGDTDQAWRRGVRYIVKRDMLGETVHARLRHIDN
ncbi:DUF3280 domain-containing protein [Breoghania sp. L-A4]|uniref:DUF3280 domain-containing protein n=1 Tax=Breoghania sp. L-A4 TaxID=2304600 RepID=UPI000E357F86|nr:DUF3280 domain-containing protein [Breoghania sp. L-A4]AXS39761.1 DUF2380 domain-containing protein [Breoghania sp. L-A4]